MFCRFKKTSAFQPRDVPVFDGDDVFPVTCDAYEWVSGQAKIQLENSVETGAKHQVHHLLSDDVF